MKKAAIALFSGISLGALILCFTAPSSHADTFLSSTLIRSSSATGIYANAIYTSKKETTSHTSTDTGSAQTNTLTSSKAALTTKESVVPFALMLGSFDTENGRIVGQKTGGITGGAKITGADGIRG